MSRLVKHKVNYGRRNGYRPVLDKIEVEVGGWRDNTTGEVSLIINSNPADGDIQYRLDLSREEVKKLEWLFRSPEEKRATHTIPGIGEFSISEE
jgi:hypothetical protein